MNETEYTLDQMSPGQKAVVLRLDLRGGMRRRLQDLGLICGTMIECVGVSPLGDPIAFLIRGAVIAVRRADCARVLVSRC